MIGTILELSSSHITEADALLLSSKDGRNNTTLIYENEYGWLLYRPSVSYVDEGFTDIGLSEAFKDALVYAFMELKVDFLRIDRDAEAIRSLPTFDW